MKHSASLRFPFDKGQAPSIVAALAPEAAEGPAGTRTELSVEADDVVIRIEAADLSGLRAAINSAVRLLDVASSVS